MEGENFTAKKMFVQTVSEESEVEGTFSHEKIYRNNAI